MLLKVGSERKTRRKISKMQNYLVKTCSAAPPNPQNTHKHTNTCTPTCKNTCTPTCKHTSTHAHANTHTHVQNWDNNPTEEHWPTLLSQNDFSKPIWLRTCFLSVRSTTHCIWTCFWMSQLWFFSVLVQIIPWPHTFKTRGHFILCFLRKYPLHPLKQLWTIM